MLDRKLLLSVGIIVLLTCYDLNRAYVKQISTKSTSTSTSPSTSNDLSEQSSDDTSTIPSPKMKMHKVSVIKLRYCQSSGYQNHFKQFSELIGSHYPNMAVVGEPYPPPPLRAFIARLLSMVKIAFFICLLFGQNPFSLFHITTPRVYLWALQNKIYACLMIFFLSNSLESYLTSSGAFEISIDDVPLWSKLDTGRLPASNEFIQMLQTFNLNLNTNEPVRLNN